MRKRKNISAYIFGGEWMMLIPATILWMELVSKYQTTWLFWLGTIIFLLGFFLIYEGTPEIKIEINRKMEMSK